MVVVVRGGLGTACPARACLEEADIHGGDAHEHGDAVGLALVPVAEAVPEARRAARVEVGRGNDQRQRQASSGRPPGDAGIRTAPRAPDPPPYPLPPPAPELWDELHGGAAAVGAEPGVDDAVDVVHRERVDDAVPLGPLPGGAEGVDLGGDALVGVEGALGAAGGS